MKIRISKKILIIIAIFLLISLTFIPECFAGIAPGDITGNPSNTPDVNVDFVDKLAGIIRTIGIFIAVGVIMIIGIKYMTGSLEEKANYKKSMFPYLIGCVLLFGASTIAPQIMETFKENQNAEDIGNLILGIIQVVGTFVAVAVLMILGIKYMLGSLEERASYKKSMLPYIIGAVLLFGGVNITTSLYNHFALDKDISSQETTYTEKSDGKTYCDKCGAVIPDMAKEKGECFGCGRQLTGSSKK